MIAITIFVFGLIVGSFLNALIHRLKTGESVVSDRSHCPHCKHELTALDLIPVVSFFMLRGKCRYCRKKISWQYPLVELATGISFLLLAQNYQLPITNYQFWFEIIFTCFLIVIFVYDLKHYLILDKVVFPAAAIALLYQIVQDNLWAALLSAALLSGFFALLYFYSKGQWIGFGDVKFGIFLGFLAPFPQTLAVFFLAYIIGAVVSVGLVLLGSKKMKDQIPFGTFLAFAGFLTLLWGDQLVSWYLGLIGL